MSDTNFKALIFDMDGVLVDSEPLHYEAEKFTLARFGLDFPRHIHLKYIGFANEKRFWEELMAHFGADVPVPELMKVKKEYFYAHLDTITLIEPARNLLDRAHRTGLSIALASSSGPFMIDTLLGLYDLKKYFSVVQSGEHVAHGKPHPDIFLVTAERLGIAPHECIVFEDSLNGVKSGKAAGMTVVAVPNEYTRSFDFSIADHVIGSLDEFSRLGLVTLP